MTDINEKVRTACHRIEELWNETGGKCYVSFSGGKDSTVLLAIVKMCIDVYTIPPEGIKAVYCDTGIELGVNRKFVRWCKDSGWYPNIEIIHPEKSFDWVMKTKGKPVRSKVRSEFLHRWKKGTRTQSCFQNLVLGQSNSGKTAGHTKLADRDMHMLHDDFPILPSPDCCNFLKKKPFHKYAKEHGIKGEAIGIRRGEGGVRELNAMNRLQTGQKLCTVISPEGIIKKMPIIDWSDDDVNEFAKEYKVPLSEAYTKFGFDRTGCMACPFSNYIDHDLEYLFYNEPNRYKASMFWLKDVYIAQNVVLPFDEAYERERERMWLEVYEPMRQEMLRKYRPNSRLIKDDEQLTLFGLEG